MRVGLAVLAVLLFFVAVPRDAHAAEAPAASAHEDEQPAPLEQREDWIAVAGIVCYSVVPVVLIVVASVLTYRFFAQQAEGALLAPWSRGDWIFRGARGAGPPAVPDGLLRWRF